MPKPCTMNIFSINTKSNECTLWKLLLNLRKKTFDSCHLWDCTDLTIPTLRTRLNKKKKSQLWSPSRQWNRISVEVWLMNTHVRTHWLFYMYEVSPHFHHYHTLASSCQFSYERGHPIWTLRAVLHIRHTHFGTSRAASRNPAGL